MPPSASATNKSSHNSTHICFWSSERTFDIIYMHIFLIRNPLCKIKQTVGRLMLVHSAISLVVPLWFISTVCFTFCILFAPCVEFGCPSHSSSSIESKSASPLVYSCILQSTLLLSGFQLFSYLFVIFTCFCEETNDDSLFVFSIHRKNCHTALSC